MIRKYQEEDRLLLGEFFTSIIEKHKQYISHGELQMGIATEPGVLAEDYKQKWLVYLDRQTENPLNRLLVYEEEGILKGFVIFGISKDGAEPYGIVFDLAVAPELRGKSVGKLLLEEALTGLREQGIHNCYLESGVNNHSAHHFFEKQGFEQVSAIFRMKL